LFLLKQEEMVITQTEYSLLSYLMVSGEVHGGRPRTTGAVVPRKKEVFNDAYSTEEAHLIMKAGCRLIWNEVAEICLKLVIWRYKLSS
jgi:hypothetical protein